MLKKFAEELKEARIKSEVTIQQIHNKTRIDVKFLEAIENGNFEILPEVYLRAFIRDYAKAIGLDEFLIMKKYDAAKSGKLIEEKTEEELSDSDKIKELKAKKIFSGVESYSSPAEDKPVSKPIKLSPKQIFLIIAAAVLLVLIYIFVIDSSTEDLVTEKSYEEIIAENRQRFDQNSKSDSLNQSNTSKGSTDSLSLLIKANDTSWIGIKQDGKTPLTEFTLFKTNKRVVKAAKEFLVIVGNSKNIELYLNNKSLGFFGNYKERKIVRVDSSGIKYLPNYYSLEEKND